MPPVKMKWTEADAFLAEAVDRDGQDPLASFRDRFHMPPHGDGDALYFTGNSLGLQPVQASTFIEGELEDWRRFGVEGHFHGRRPWVDYHSFATEDLAALVGALPVEVVAMNALTVNLHLLLVSFYRPEGGRTKLMIEEGAERPVRGPVAIATPRLDPTSTSSNWPCAMASTP